MRHFVCLCSILTSILRIAERSAYTFFLFEYRPKPSFKPNHCPQQCCSFSQSSHSLSPNWLRGQYNILKLRRHLLHDFTLILDRSQAFAISLPRVKIITRSSLSLSADHVDYIHFRQRFPERSYGLNCRSWQV